MELLTRANMRERIRRDRLGIITPLQMSLASAAAGDVPTYQPDPSNESINAAIEEALAELNSDIFFATGSSLIPISVAAQTANGPYRINLQTAISSYTALGQINTTRHVHWTPTSGPVINLTPRTFLELNRDYQDIYNTPVGMPNFYSIEGYQILLFPAPSVVGTLYLEAGLSMLSPTSDTDTVGQLPADFMPVIMDMATVQLIPTLIGDVEMQARAQMLVPRAANGKLRVAKWFSDQQQGSDNNITHRSHRSWFTGRRR